MWSTAGNSLIKASRSARCTESQTPSLQPLCLSCHSDFTHASWSRTEFNTQHISSSSTPPRQGDQQGDQHGAGGRKALPVGDVTEAWKCAVCCAKPVGRASRIPPHSALLSQSNTQTPGAFQARNECFGDNYRRLANSVSFRMYDMAPT